MNNFCYLNCAAAKNLDPKFYILIFYYAYINVIIQYVMNIHIILCNKYVVIIYYTINISNITIIINYLNKEISEEKQTPILLPPRFNRC